MEKINQYAALLRIDLQNDFMPGGALAVNDGDKIIAAINKVSRQFHNNGGIIVDSQDMHPAGHSSFASAHEGKQPFEAIQMPYGTQTLWPDHCVAGSFGAKFHNDVDVDVADLVIRKGTRHAVDSYSAFYENDQETRTYLDEYLKARYVEDVYLCGLAYDFCVGYSAIDAHNIGFNVYVVKDLCKAIDMPTENGGTVAEIERAFAAAGIKVITSDQIQF